MKNKIKLEVEKINKILREEIPYNDWHKGRHSALRGVKVALECILSGEDVKLREVCPECGYPRYQNTFEKFDRCHGCEWTGTRE